MTDIHITLNKDTHIRFNKSETHYLVRAKAPEDNIARGGGDAGRHLVREVLQADDPDRPILGHVTLLC